MTEVVAPGGTATTDTEADGATAADPVETSVTSPNGGTVSIVEATTTMTPPSGFSFLGQQVSITAPAATAADPLVIVFQIDASAIPAGEDETTVQVFKNGVLVPACTGAPGVADPDPCISNRTLLADGDIELTALSSTASDWNFGVAPEPTPTPPGECLDLNNDGKVSGRDVRIVARALITQNPAGDVNNDGHVDLDDLFLVLGSLLDRDCR